MASRDISKATDRGVNNCGSSVGPCVKLGFLLAKLGGIDQSGQALGLRDDISRVIDAYVAYQNKKGGILGRRIVAEKRPTDTISQSDQLQACTEFTQDKKVFGVVDTTSLIFANTQQCFIQDNKTPLVHSYAESEAFMDAGKGYDVTTIRSLDRIAAQWADEIGKLGFLKGGEKVGVLQDNCEPSNGVVRKVLIAGIMKYRPASVKSYETDCSAASAQAQPPALQSQMCVDGVTHVLLATSFVAAQTFLQSADGGPCGSGDRKYRYMASDYSLLASDLRTRNFPARQFDGSLAVTNLFTGIATPSAQNQLCSRILKDAGLPGVDNGYQNAEATAICDYFFIMVGNAEAAGANLTRAGWAQASQRLGTFKGAFVPESRYEPGKTNGGELVHAMTWRANCTCYRSIGPLHVGAG
ncbi:MAG: ABC transporter substrate-binding protein [Frankiales bacterium]|nr:ABC transporter substrate-binding protein [Frankiales bacterium]